MNKLYASSSVAVRAEAICLKQTNAELAISAATRRQEAEQVSELAKQAAEVAQTLEARDADLQAAKERVVAAQEALEAEKAAAQEALDAEKAAAQEALNAEKFSAQEALDAEKAAAHATVSAREAKLGAVQQELAATQGQFESTKKLASDLANHIEAARAEKKALEAEKETRIAHMADMAARRFSRKELARGWTSWMVPYLESKRLQRMMRKVDGRLRKPRVSAGFAHWRIDWEADLRAKAAKEAAEAHKAKLQAAIAAQKAEVQSLKEELGAARRATALLQPKTNEEVIVHARLAARNAKSEEVLSDELRAAQDQLTSAQQELDAEKERRIEHTAEMAVRRLLKRELSRGWTSWVTPYLTQKHLANLMRRAEGRLQKPKLSAGFDHWRIEWKAEERENAALAAAMAAEAATAVTPRSVTLAQQLWLKDIESAQVDTPLSSANARSSEVQRLQDELEVAKKQLANDAALNSKLAKQAVKIADSLESSTAALEAAKVALEAEKEQNAVKEAELQRLENELAAAKEQQLAAAQEALEAEKERALNHITEMTLQRVRKRDARNCFNIWRNEWVREQRFRGKLTKAVAVTKNADAELRKTLEMQRSVPRLRINWEAKAEEAAKMALIKEVEAARQEVAAAKEIALKVKQDAAEETRRSVEAMEEAEKVMKTAAEAEAAAKQQSDEAAEASAKAANLMQYLALQDARREMSGSPETASTPANAPTPTSPTSNRLAPIAALPEQFRLSLTPEGESPGGSLLTRI